MRLKVWMVFLVMGSVSLPGCSKQGEPRPGPVLTERGAAVPGPAVEDSGETHVVKEGEDIYSVAIWWDVTPTALMNLNNLTGSELRPGQRLKIPRQGH